MVLLRSLVVWLAATSLAAGQRCYEKLTARSGIIQSPGYPSNYPPNTDCYWEIARPKDGACVLFTVEDFNVPSEDEALCPGDHFVLESCGSWWTVSPERYYCGDYSEYIRERGSFNLVQHYQVNATSLRVSFHSDSVNQAKGFLMQYQILDADQCVKYGSAGYNKVKNSDGSDYDCVTLSDKESGSINTPNYPGLYPPKTACAYGFQKPSKDYCGVLIKTTKFDLEARDGSTCHDYFGMPGCRKMCGQAKRPDFLYFEYQKGADAFFLQFVSDFSTEGHGFKIDYLQVKDCFNPHQPECPNDQLNSLAVPSECPAADRHECNNNKQCKGNKICCFDGCLRSCKAPVSNGRRRRSIDQFLAGSSLEAGLLNSAPHEIMKRSPQFVRARL